MTLSFLLSGMLQCQEIVDLTQVIKVEHAVQISGGYIRTTIPNSISNKQTVLDVSFSPLPDQFCDTLGSYSAEWKLVNFEKGDSIIIKYRLLLNRWDLFTAKRRGGKIKRDTSISEYLKHERNIQKDNKKIHEKALELVGNSEEETVKSIFNFVKEHLEYYNYSQEDRGAKRALRQGKGDCTEYSELMISLTRANGIPARIVGGLVLGGNGHVGLHNWVEVYLSKYGWIPFDPTFADSDSIYEYSKMMNIYVTLTNRRYVSSCSWKYIGKYMEIEFSNFWEEPTEYMDALRLYNSNRNREALEVIDSLLGIAPLNCNFLSLKGAAHGRLNEFEKGLQVFQIASKYADFEREKMQVYYAYANFLALKGEPTSAISFLKAAIKNGFDDFEFLIQDDDLKSLRGLKEFDELIPQEK